MQTRVYKLFAGGSADTNAASTLTFQNNGFIQCIMMGMQLNSVADGNILEMELSFASAFLGTTNDTIGPLAQLTHRNEDSGTAATTLQTAKNLVIPGIYIPVVSGDRLYLNFEQTGTITWSGYAFLYVLI